MEEPKIASDPFADLIAKTIRDHDTKTEDPTRIIRRPTHPTPNHDDLIDPTPHGDPHRTRLPHAHGNVANLFSAFISFFLFLIFIACGFGAFIATCFWR